MGIIWLNCCKCGYPFAECGDFMICTCEERYCQSCYPDALSSYGKNSDGELKHCYSCGPKIAEKRLNIKMDQCIDMVSEMLVYKMIHPKLERSKSIDDILKKFLD